MAFFLLFVGNGISNNLGHFLCGKTLITNYELVSCAIIPTGGKLNGIKTAVSTACTNIKTSVTTAWNNIKTGVSTTLTNIGNERIEEIVVKANKAASYRSGGR